VDHGGTAADTVIVLTALQLEHRAVRAHLVDVRQEWHPSGTYFEVGRLPNAQWRVVLMVTGAGNVPAAVLTERAVTWYRPHALLVVGIAGALHDDIRLGDVVVSTWVYGYHGGMADDEGFRARPRAWEASHLLSQAARATDVAGEWSAPRREPIRPTVHFRPIAAGEVVLNSVTAPLAQQLAQNYNDAAAIEMESAGAVAAAHASGSLDFLAIRGISDRADGNKHAADGAGLQAVAAEHAAAFASAMLRRLPIAKTIPTTQGEPGAGMGNNGGNSEPTASGGTWVQHVVGGGGGPVYAVQDGNQYIGGASPAAPPPPGVPEPSVPAKRPVAHGSTSLLAFRGLDVPLPVTWRRDLDAGWNAVSGVLELHVVPVDQQARLEMRRLATLGEELAMLGRSQGLFGAAEEVQCVAAGAVATAVTKGSGLAVTRGGQRSTWQPLPHDMLGAVLDADDLVERLTTMLALLIELNAPEPAEVGLAVAIDPATMVSEGRVADMPRSRAHIAISLPTSVQVRADDALRFDRLTADAAGIGEEMAARLLAQFRTSPA
jgi:nucleoside phosphorylase